MLVLDVDHSRRDRYLRMVVSHHTRPGIIQSLSTLGLRYFAISIQITVDNKAHAAMAPLT